MLEPKSTSRSVLALSAVHFSSTPRNSRYSFLKITSRLQGAFDAGAYSFFGDMAPLDEGLGGALEVRRRFKRPSASPQLKQGVLHVRVQVATAVLGVFVVALYRMDWRLPLKSFLPKVHSRTTRICQSRH